MGDTKEYLSKEKFAELTKELEELKTVKRRQVADDLEYAKGLGDLSENAEYQEARTLQATIEERISKLEMILKSAEIVAPHHTTAVGVGSTVHVRKEGEKADRVFKIVGSEESDVLQGKLSVRSPMGTALQGKKKGDAFILSTPGGKMNYTVISID